MKQLNVVKIEQMEVNENKSVLLSLEIEPDTIIGAVEHFCKLRKIDGNRVVDFEGFIFNLSDEDIKALEEFIENNQAHVWSRTIADGDVNYAQEKGYRVAPMVKTPSEESPQEMFESQKYVSYALPEKLYSKPVFYNDLRRTYEGELSAVNIQDVMPKIVHQKYDLGHPFAHMNLGEKTLRVPLHPNHMTANTLSADFDLPPEKAILFMGPSRGIFSNETAFDDFADKLVDGNQYDQLFNILKYQEAYAEVTKNKNGTYEVTAIIQDLDFGWWVRIDGDQLNKILKGE